MYFEIVDHLGIYCPILDNVSTPLRTVSFLLLLLLLFLLYCIEVYNQNTMGKFSRTLSHI